MPTMRTAQHRKACAFRDFKALDEAQGTFSGYLAVFNNTDQGGDVIEPGAFAKTLHEAKARKGNEDTPFLWPILWQHDEHEPIGGFTDAKEDAYGLYVTGQLDLSTELGRRAYSGMKMGYMRGLSIGYDALKHKWIGEARHLQELRLWEGSAVTFPMNTEALVNNVKSTTGGTGGDITIAADGTHAAFTGTHVHSHTAKGSQGGDAVHEHEHTHDGDANHGHEHGKAARARGMERKARDFGAIFANLQHSDELQEEWHDTFQAFVTSTWNALMDAKYPPYVPQGETLPDFAALAQNNIDQFSAAMSDLVTRSIAASFAPMLDCDGDSFDDPDDDDDDGAYGYMSADRRAEQKARYAEKHPTRVLAAPLTASGASGAKAGRTLSADNHAMMTKALDMIASGHKAISAFANANAPTGNAPSANPGDEPPTISDNVYDPAFGKSIADFYEYAHARAGARTKAAAATTPTTGAGALPGTHATATTQTAATPNDDDHTPMRDMLAEMRQMRSAKAN